ncbi:hypothetical protein [Nocardioides daejeonensis]|uniref:hypothetical protein n=1 Tax=Nocardioides daejeonensis TaxID=1046556 RepID=UPI000D745B68|nr:hypothetical protein [Nocardioides daejeonensis]
MKIPPFTSAQGLRLLLVRLHYSPAGAWTHDPDAEELMRFVARKYAALAHKYALTPDDAAYAAFEAMRTRAVRAAVDPWAVVTRAVQVSLIYEARAQGLLCSNHQARRPEVAVHHDAERFCERETDLADYHPAFHLTDRLDDEYDADDLDPAQSVEPTNAWMAAEHAAGVMVVNGWPQPTATGCIEYVCSQLIRSGDRATAYTRLVRDHHAEALLDLSHPDWVAVLQALLGNQLPTHERTREGRGLLQLLAMGYLPAELSTVPCFAQVFAATAPSTEGVAHV